MLVAPLETALARSRRLLRAYQLAGAEAELQGARLRNPESPEVVNLLGVAAELGHDLTHASKLYHLTNELAPYPPARHNSERVVFRSWKGPGAGVDIDFGDAEEDGPGG